MCQVSDHALIEVLEAAARDVRFGLINLSGLSLVECINWLSSVDAEGVGKDSGVDVAGIKAVFISELEDKRAGWHLTYGTEYPINRNI